MIASLPVGKFHAMPRCVIRTPRGCLRPLLLAGLPSQYWIQESCCDAALRPINTGSNRDVSATNASRGQLAASLELIELHTSDSLSPCTVVPLGSKKKAPVVSLAHEKGPEYTGMVSYTGPGNVSMRSIP